MKKGMYKEHGSAIGFQIIFNYARTTNSSLRTPPFRNYFFYLKIIIKIIIIINNNK